MITKLKSIKMKKTGPPRPELGPQPMLQLIISIHSHRIIRISIHKLLILIILMLFNRRIQHRVINSIHLRLHPHTGHIWLICRNLHPSVPDNLLLFQKIIYLTVLEMEIWQEIQMLYFLLKKVHLQAHRFICRRYLLVILLLQVITHLAYLFWMLKHMFENCFFITWILFVEECLKSLKLFLDDVNCLLKLFLLFYLMILCASDLMDLFWHFIW